MSLLSLFKGTREFISWGIYQIKRPGKEVYGNSLHGDRIAETPARHLDAEFAGTIAFRAIATQWPTWKWKRHTLCCFPTNISRCYKPDEAMRDAVQFAVDNNCYGPIMYDHYNRCLLIAFKSREEALLFKLTHGGEA